jgi:SSS family solute:Na+ symporter
VLGYRTDFGASLVLGQAPAHELSSIAPWILGAYLILLLVLGYLGQRRGVSNEEDYYLAGRQQGWIVSSLTIMATFFSSFALLGAPGLVYKEGVAFALFALNVPLAGAAVYVLGKRLAKAGREHGYVTPGDMIVAHYDSRIALRLLTALVGLLYAVPYVVMQINAGGILTEVLFPNAANAFEWGAVGLAIITMVYVMVGGMRSVAWTDVVQGTLLIGGMLIAGWATVETLGGVRSFFARLEELPPAALTVPGTSGSWLNGCVTMRPARQRPCGAVQSSLRRCSRSAFSSASCS